MYVLLVRHGDAVDPALADQDRMRWLTPGGRKQANAIGKELASQQVACSVVLTSPLVRAVQTAEGIIAAMGTFEGIFEAHAALDGTGSAGRMAALLDAYTDADTVMIVGHEPSIRLLAAELLGLEELFEFKKCSAWLLKREDAGWRYVYRLEPNPVRRIETLQSEPL